MSEKRNHVVSGILSVIAIAGLAAVSQFEVPGAEDDTAWTVEGPPRLLLWNQEAEVY